jgi:hypothetical protein
VPNHAEHTPDVGQDAAAHAGMKVKVFPYREKLAHGNIVWAERDRGSAYYRVSRYAGRNGRFAPDHPVAPNAEVFGREPNGSQCGSSPKLDAFRARGYWASCFPEGDGITWKPERGQSDEQCYADIRECFGWDIETP